MLRLSGLGYEFPDNHVRALSGVDLALETGCIHALLGENGAGKSTLARIVTGHVRNWTGRMDIEGEEYFPLSPGHALSRGVALVPQHPRLDTTQDLGKNLFMGHSRPDRFFYTPKLKADLQERLSSWGMEFDLSSPASDLDAPGMHWLALAEALLARPRWLFLDEPSASYPEEDVSRLYGLLADLAHRGLGIVVITHRLKEVRNHAHTIHVLRQGRLLASRETRDLADDETIHALLFPQDRPSGPAPVLPLTPRPPVSPPFARSTRIGLESNPPVTDKRVPATGKPGSSPKPVHDSPDRPDSPEHVNHPIAPATPDREGLSVSGLEIHTGHGRRLALELRADRGSTLGILGHWDQGLEDLEDHLAGLRRKQAWAIRFGGQELGQLDPGLKGYIPSRRFQRGIAVGLGIKDNVMIRTRGKKNMPSQGPRDSGIREKLPLAADRDWNQAIETLSGGMIQKLIIHRETALPKPELLVCAEPWWGLDFQAQGDMARMLREFNTGNEVILILSSDIDEIMALSEHATVLGPEGIETPVQVAGTTRAYWERRLVRQAEVYMP